jgi:hypothetical protein
MEVQASLKTGAGLTKVTGMTKAASEKDKNFTETES